MFSELVNKRQARGALLLRWTVENLTDQVLLSFVFLVVLAHWKLKKEKKRRVTKTELSSHLMFYDTKCFQNIACLQLARN